jgi:hypothetical protein
MILFEEDHHVLNEPVSGPPWEATQVFSVTALPTA